MLPNKVSVGAIQAAATRTSNITSREVKPSCKLEYDPSRTNAEYETLWIEIARCQACYFHVRQSSRLQTTLRIQNQMSETKQYFFTDMKCDLF